MFDIIGKVFFLSIVFLAGAYVGIAGIQQLFVSIFGA